MLDIMVFLRRFFIAPSRVGSLVPSSRFLSERMLQQVNWNEARVIVELGPGTGVFTKEILEYKHPDSLYFVVERDPQFRDMLLDRFPELVIYEEAVLLDTYLQKMGVSTVDVIISGLPFAVFTEEQRASILDQVEKVLTPGGLFITFQYSLQLRAELEARFEQMDIDFTPLNIPPAFIYTCRR